MTKEKTQKAIEIWERIIRTVPERSYLAFDRLEKAYAQNGGPAKFIQLCERQIQANPQDWRARLSLGRYLTQHGEQTRALNLFFDSLVNNPHALAVHQAIWRSLTELDFNPLLVRRYIGLTQDAVFYLDPHVCIKCRYRSTELLWQCPQCHEWNTFIEERIAPAEELDLNIPAEAQSSA